ncbi:hypothetical protein JB92DRAFT_2832400 [Gautieria morchelliformis]|nr:hypothetical protein JB92DRAFT_2832400 [Gautieria morchelliformis]
MAISNETTRSSAIQQKARRKVLGQPPGQFMLGVAGPLDGIPDESIAGSSTKPLLSQLVRLSPDVEPRHLLDDLTAEDLAIWSADCSRWDNPEYWLRIEEMMVFVEMFNSLSTACGLHTWFCISPGMSTSFAEALSGGTSLLEQHERTPFTYIMFMDLHQNHWTLFYHSLGSTPRNACTRYNPTADMQGHSTIVDQWVIHNYLLPAGTPPIPLDTPYVSFPTHLQDDSSTCGFWVVIIALTLLLHADTRDVYQLRPADIKQMLATIYASYVCGDEGLTIEQVAQAMAQHKLSPIALHNMHNNDTTRSASDKSKLLFLALCDYELLGFTVNGIYPLNAAKLQALRSQGELSETVINSYFHLYTLDCHTSTSDLASFKIFDTILADRIRDAPLTATFGPPGQGRGRRKKGSKLTSWVPDCDVFNYGRLLLPWFIAKKRHWILVAINMQTMLIRIYDSMTPNVLMHKHIYERILRFLAWESHCSDRGEISGIWRQNSDEHMRSESNITDCGVYLVAFTQELVRGGDPEAPTYLLSAGDIEGLRTQIGQRLACEWQDQQAVPHASFSHCKSNPAPFPLSEWVEPFKMTLRVPNTHNPASTNVILSAQVRETYVPRMDAWALWPLAPGDLHFPARITACDISSQVATFRVFYDILPLPNTYEFTRTFAECYDLMGAPDDSVPELQTYQIPKLRWPADLDTRDLEAAEAQGLADDQIRDILSPAKAAAHDYLCTVIDTVAEILAQPSRTPFNRLVDQWNERLAKRTRSTLDAGLTFDFFREHSQYLDNVDAYIIGSFCASRLACVLGETHGIQGHLEQTNLAFGPGCAILAYYLLGNRLGLGAEETYVLADQGDLYRPSSDHELVWEAMRGRVSLSVKGHDDFERTRRIMDATIKLPGVEVSFASDPKAHIEEAPSRDVDKRDADTGRTKEHVPQEAVTVIPKAGQMESPDVLQGHKDEAMASGSEVQQTAAVKEPSKPTQKPSQGEAESVERARVEHAATNKTEETRSSLAIDAALAVGSALATDQLPLIRLVKTTEGWKAFAGALPHGKQREDTSGDGLATNYTGTQKISNAKRKRSPEGVLAPAVVGRRLRPRK